MKKSLTCFILCCTFLSMYMIYAMIVWSGRNYLPWQTVNGTHYDTYTEAVTAICEELYSPVRLSILDKVYTCEKLQRFQITEDTTNTTFFTWLTTRDFKLSVVYAYDTDKLREMLQSIYKPCTDAYIETVGNEVKLIPEYYGCEFDVETVIQNVISQQSNIVEVTLNKPRVTKDDLQTKYANLKRISNINITYTNGYSIKYDDIKPFVVDNNLDIPDDFYDTVCEQLSKDYNSIGKTTTFKNHSGESINIKYNTYGHTLDVEAEKEFLRHNLYNTATHRTPCLTGYDDLNDTYVEVSLNEQHVWHVVNGNICCESDVVTGLPSRANGGTPTGVFYISEKVNGKYLTGPGYKSWVNKWMRLNNNGIGLHDANWRRTFGKDIYLHDGSHGCINLPKDYAYSLYDEVRIGTPVIIH